MAVSVAYYPMVGLALGGLLAGCSVLSGLFFPPLVTGILLAGLLAVFTRGLHLDGLADTADALLSHQDRSRKLEIMKDSRIGVFGAAALIFVLGLKVLLLAQVSGPEGWPVLALFPMWGRLAVSTTACLSVYARREGGLGRPFINLAGPRQLYLAAGSALIFSLFYGLPGLITTLVVILAALVGVRVWQRQLGGVTGDVLGATAELGECLALLAAAAWL